MELEMSAEEIVKRLGLEAHPEGGCYRETWRHVTGSGERGAGTAIYFLLRQGEVSRWHRVDAAEIWHYYAGSPLELKMKGEDGNEVIQILGVDLAGGQRPQRTVPPHVWQSARSLGTWTLVGCTVSPAFVFDGFEMAEESVGSSAE